MGSIFHDADADAAKRDGGLVRVGRCTVRLPSRFGFCGGVRHALKTLRETLERSCGKPVWLLGEVIHNDTVNRYFRDQGVTILPEAELASVLDRAGPDDVIVIPAFGIPKELDVKLRASAESGARIVDTTCRYVARIWDFVEEMAGQRRTILVQGKANHPEIRATLSRALTPENAVVLVADPAAAARVAAAIRRGSAEDLPAEWLRNRSRLDFRNMAIVSQTTLLHSESREVAALIGEAARDAGGDLESASTVCRATQDRQEAALELCRQGCDVILVVGGYASSNTYQLYRLAREHCPTYFVRDADALSPDRIRHYRPETEDAVILPDWLPPDVRDVGVLAGASCPPCDIGDVIRKLVALLKAQGN